MLGEKLVAALCSVVQRVPCSRCSRGIKWFKQTNLPCCLDHDAFFFWVLLDNTQNKTWSPPVQSRMIFWDVTFPQKKKTFVGMLHCSQLYAAFVFLSCFATAATYLHCCVFPCLNLTEGLQLPVIRHMDVLSLTFCIWSYTIWFLFFPSQ